MTPILAGNLNQQTLHEPLQSRAPSSVNPENQDYLDVDRLRLLTARSTRPASTRPRSTFPFPSKADGGKLPPVNESSRFSENTPWIKVDNSLLRQTHLLSGSSFERGDGINMYIDGARFLPDLVSVTKVTVAALNADRSQTPLSEGCVFADPGSSVHNPRFDYHAEVRDPSCNPTLTLVVRVDTIEASKMCPVILGYALIPLFIDPETQEQPSRSSIQRFMLNQGGFQVPLYTNAQVDTSSQESFSANATGAFPKIPCATLLVRINSAPRGKDGISLLSRKDHPETHWEALGLKEHPPLYSEGNYDSSASLPTATESAMYRCRQKRKSSSVAEVCGHLFEKRGNTSALEAAKGLMKNKPRDMADLRRLWVYFADIGFRVSVDGGHNLKSKSVGSNGIFKVVTSLCPPASLYEQISLSSGVHFTTSIDWSSTQTSPEFKDGFMSFRDAPGSRSLAVIFDVHGIVRHVKTGQISVHQVGWSFLPVLSEVSSVLVGNYQLPVIQGPVNIELLKSTLNASELMAELSMEKKKSPVAFLEGASLFVRLEDPQVPIETGSPIAGATRSPMIPSKLAAKYTYDPAKVAALKKKAPMSKLKPPTMTEVQFEKTLNEAFARELGMAEYPF